MRRIAAIIFPILVLGCGGVSDRPPIAPVSGTVTMGGNPVADATVTFHFDGEGAPTAGQGKTDSAGKFRISTFDTNDGAIVGTHTVTVAKIEADPNQAAGDMDMEGDAYGKAMNAAAAGTDERKNLINIRYAKKETSPLKVTVEAGGKDDARIELEE